MTGSSTNGSEQCICGAELEYVVPLGPVCMNPNHTETVVTTMAQGLAEYLRDLAGKVERGDLCNGEVWERLYADGPEPVEYTAGLERDGRQPGTGSEQ